MDELRKQVIDLSHAVISLRRSHDECWSRLMATEAVVVRLLPMLDLAVLHRLQEEYEEQETRLLSAISPDRQAPEQWENIRCAIAEAIAHRMGRRPGSASAV